MKHYRTSYHEQYWLIHISIVDKGSSKIIRVQKYVKKIIRKNKRKEVYYAKPTNNFGSSL